MPLLEDVAWARGLARRLVRDEHLAEDIAQEAWLAARGSCPRSPRAWIGAIVRRLAATTLRRRERRHRREERSARPEGEPPTVDLVACAEAQRRVVDAVLALPEPYRGTVLMRWFEDLDPRAIARRRGEPLGTVRTRLRRAHDMLRARLEREYGSGRAWCAALLALAAAPRRASAAVLGGIAVKTKTTAAVALAAVALLTLWGVARRVAPPQARGGPGARAVATAPHADAPRPPDPLEEKAGREEPRTVRVAGWVLGRDGGVAGAQVFALDRPSGAQLDLFDAFGRAVEPRAVTRSAERGCFVFDVPASGALALAAVAPGYGAALVDDVDFTVGAGGVVLRLGAPGLVRGRVADPDGNPVLGASVGVVGGTVPLPMRTETGVDGAFELDGVPAGTCGLIVRHPAMLDVYVPKVEAPAAGLIVRMEPGAVLEGVVLTLAGREPVAGARIVSTGNGVGPGALPVATETDGAGRFRIPVPRFGLASIAVDAGARGRAALQAVPWEERWKLEAILLPPTRTVRGRVVDTEGDPVADVLVAVWDEESGWGFGARTARSGKDGRFTVAGVGEQPSSLLVPDPRFDCAGRVHPGDWTGEILVPVVPLPTVRGLVVDRAEGRPVPGARVECGAVATYAEPDGTFVLRHVPRSVREVSASREGAGTGTASLPADGDVRIALEPERIRGGSGGVELRGRVEDEGGRPVAGAKVSACTVREQGGNRTVLSHGTTFAWSDGTYAIRGIPEGDTVTVGAALPGFAAAQADVLAAPGTVEAPVLVLRSSPTLRGRVVDVAGEPVPAMALMVQLWNREHKLRYHVWTDAGGRFELTGAVAGEWAVHARGEVTHVTVPPAGPVEIRLAAGSGLLSIEGTVLDAEGRPVPKATLWITDTRGKRTWWQAGLDGRFRCTGLRPGVHDVGVGFPYVSGPPRSRQVFDPLPVRAGTTDVRLRARWGMTITGRLVAAPGTDLTGASVAARAGEGTRVYGRVESDGRFRVEGLHDAVYTLSVRGRGLRAEPREGVRAGSEDVEIDVSAGFSIEGRLVGPNGGAPRRPMLRLFPEEGPTVRVPVEADGSFRVDGLAPGRYGLEATALGGLRARAEAAAGETGLLIRLE